MIRFDPQALPAGVEHAAEQEAGGGTDIEHRCDGGMLTEQAGIFRPAGDQHVLLEQVILVAGPPFKKVVVAVNLGDVSGGIGGEGELMPAGPAFVNGERMATIANRRRLLAERARVLIRERADGSRLEIAGGGCLLPSLLEGRGSTSNFRASAERVQPGASARPSLAQTALRDPSWMWS